MLEKRLGDMLFWAIAPLSVEDYLLRMMFEVFLATMKQVEEHLCSSRDFHHTLELIQDLDTGGTGLG